MASRIPLLRPLPTPAPGSGFFSRFRKELQATPMQLVPSRKDGPYDSVIFEPRNVHGRVYKWRVAGEPGAMRSRIG